MSNDTSTQVLFDAPGPKGKALNVILGVVAVVLIVAAVGGLIYLMRSQLGPEKWAPFFDPESWQYYVVPGLINTVQAAALAVVISLIFGILLGMGRLSIHRAIHVPVGIFVEFFRSVPVLILMVFFYQTLRFVGITGTTLQLVAVVLGLVFYNATVIAELVRSGVMSLPRGQREAGLVVGLTEGQSLRMIMLPQALTAMLPSLLNQLVVILKDTALGYIITYPELLQTLRYLGTRYGNLVVVFLVGCFIMIALNFALTSLAQLLQRSLARRGRGHSKATTAPIV